MRKAPERKPTGTIDRRLLRRFLVDYPFQPATALFRAVEVAVLIEHGLPPGRGLDLGCGDGLLTRILLEACGPREMVGLDPDPLEAAMARGLGIYSAVHVAGGASIPEADASFDWVVSNSVLEHVDDLQPVLLEVARVLRPGGFLLFTVPSDGFPSGLRGSLLPGVSRRRYLEALDRRLHHLRYWRGQGWPPLPAALRIEVARPYLTRGQLRRWETLSRMTAGMLAVLTRGRRRPIDLQRSLGMRRGAHMPGWLATALAALLGAGAGRDRSGAACELVVARRVSPDSAPV